MFMPLTEGGILLRFTKYMEDSALTGENIRLNGDAVTLTLLDSERAPANIRYEG